MILELVNPSDAITFVGDDAKIAGVACLLLGNGWYALEKADGELFVPLMAFGRREVWLKENGIDDFGAYVQSNAIAIAEFLETCAYGHIAEREAFDQAIARMSPKKADEHRAWWNDRNRSSMNDIGAGAARLAQNLRNLAEKRSADLTGSPPLVLSRP